MDASTLLNNTNDISNSIGTGGNYNEKVSPCADPVVHMSVSEALKQLKKLERDYQHTCESYLETRSNRYSSYIKRRHSNYRSGQAGNCIIYYKKLREKLQNDLEKLNKAEETQRRTEKPDCCKQFLMLHGCNSLAKEKRILNQIGEAQQQEQEQQSPEYNDLGQKRIYFKQRNWEWEVLPLRIPSSNKGIHDLLRSLKDTEKLRNKTTASGELVDNQTSQDSLKTSIKILTKVIKRLGKETGTKTMIDDGYEEKIKQLEEKCEWICGQWDEQKKYIVGLKKIHEDGGCSKLVICHR
ncbi:uncharacterized protein LOC108858580 [Raphanus sativus]|uniref:Uncharacterized protein LOC108858580 n=1 Tax=Raphanus sativus TaxID=3726 RepID=A0A9W3DTG7_RAPSA|nr:uncharacterized protein LOC108858580 [Raphanus sativus]